MNQAEPALAPGDATGTPATSAHAGAGRGRLAVLLGLGAVALFAIGLTFARRGTASPDTTAASGAVSALAVASPGANLPLQRIAGVADLPGGPVDHVEVAYFHRTHRCSGCINAERLTRMALETRFADRLAAGDISLVVEDTEAPADPALVARYEAWGSALFLSVAKGGRVYALRLDDIWFYVNEDDQFVGYLAQQIHAIYGDA